MEFPRNIHSLPIAHGAARIRDRRGGDAWRWRRHRVRRRNENSQNEPGMSAGINDIENRGVEGAPSHRAAWLGKEWNVSWNQQFRFICSTHRKLCALQSTVSRIQAPPPSQIGRFHESGERPSRGVHRRDWGGAYMAVFAMCASRGRSSRLAHIARGAMYAPPEVGEGALCLN